MATTMLSMLTVAQDQDDETVVDEPPPPPEYIGTRECRDCHRDHASAHSGTVHALTMVEIEEDMDPEDNPVIADFEMGADVRTVTFPDGETRAFTLEDVAFNLGAGRNKQAFIYLTETEDDEVYYIFPAEWNVAEGIWEDLVLAETWPSDAYAFGPNCAGCHTVGVDTSDYDWEEEGVQCETCHGPGLDHVELADDAGGSIDDEERAEIYASINLGYGPATCAQCHVRGLAEDGVHPYPVEFYANIHDDLSDFYTPFSQDNDEHWWASGHARLPNMQHNEWLISGHPNALTTAQASENFSAECLTCHSTTQQLIDLRLGNEDIDPETVDPQALIESNDFGITCASCHVSHRIIDDDDDETVAAMAELPAMLREDSYSLCTSCHSDNDITEDIHHPVREVFEGITIIADIEVTASPHFTEDSGPTCSTCHMQALETYNGERNSHASSIVSPGSAIDVEGLQDSCSGCHEEGPAELQQLIDALQTDTQQRISTAQQTLSDDTEPWVMTALEIVDSEGSYGIHNHAYTSALLNSVEINLGLRESTTLSDADVSAAIDGVLPDVEPVSLTPDEAPDVIDEGLAPASIAILVLSGLILLVGIVFFFRSET